MSTGVGPSLREPVVGRVLDGRYRVLEHIADGGMASVYLALDERLDREVAVKVMRRDLVADETFVTRFRREARSAARLSHPNVVAVHDQGEDHSDMFLVMEYVPGRTLRELVQAEGPLTPRAALDLLDPVLQALDAAHSAGLIHRDVKPENVIVRSDGSVKVADFGLARAVTTATTTNTSGTMMGTVAYLSPEQVERGIADARSDVYAAGLMLFEVLTGRKAFDGDSPIHIAYQHVHGSVPVPSDVVPSVPSVLDALVALGTARDPDQRPATAGDYLVELRRARRELGTDELDLRPTPGERERAAATRTTAMPRPGSGATSVISVLPDDTQGSDDTSYDGSPEGSDDASRVPPYEASDAPRRRWPAVLGALLVAAVLLAGGAGWWFTAGPGAKVAVPRLSGLAQPAAEQSLRTAGLRSSVTATYSETAASGTVLSTDPAGGRQVSKGSAVTLVVSRGPERYTAPQLVGTPAADVAAALERAHLKPSSANQVFSETVPAGTVVSQDPEPGTTLKPGDPVTVVVSKGREPVSVPDFTGKPLAQTKDGLAAAGFTTAEGTPVNSDTVPQGAVVSQNPKDGTLYRGDKVTLVASKGPVLVEVPKVVGKQRGVAAAALRAAGFQVSFNEVLGGFFGTVRGSDPAAGTMVPKGTTITLTIV